MLPHVMFCCKHQARLKKNLFGPDVQNGQQSQHSMPQDHKNTSQNVVLFETSDKQEAGISDWLTASFKLVMEICKLPSCLFSTSQTNEKHLSL